MTLVLKPGYSFDSDSSTIPGNLILKNEAVEADPYYNNVSLLLHGDGTNGSTTITVALYRFSEGVQAYADARLAFYSIGESLDLALLDARVTTLMSDLAAAIP